MKAITKYVSEDGREFTEEAKCVAYEALCKEIAEIMAPLGPIPDLPGCGFANGGGYLQHDPATVLKAKRALLKIANTIMPHKRFAQSMESEEAHTSWAGRLIGEMSERCLWNAWHRIECTDSDGKEYGQPYFASHPNECNPVCLNA